MDREKFHVILAMTCFCLLLSVKANARTNSLSGSIFIREGYDSNIARTADNEVSGWTTTISPVLEINSQGANDTMSFSYGPGFSFDHETDKYEVDHRLSFRGDKNFTKAFQASLHETYIESSNTFIESETLQLEGERLIREVNRKDRLWTNSISFQMHYEYARESIFSLGYTNDILNHKTNISGNDDYTRHNPNTSLSYWFNTMWGVEAFYNFIKGDFDTSDDLETHHPAIRLNYRHNPQRTIYIRYDYRDTDYSGNQQKEDYKIHDLSLGVAHEINPQTSLSLFAGASRVERSISKDKDGYNLGFVLAKKMQNGALRIQGAGGFEPSDFSGTDDGPSQFWSATGSINHQMTEKSIVDVFARVRNDDYFDRTTYHEETEYSGGGGLSYSFARWFTLSLRYKYLHLDADDPLREYTDHRFYVALGAAKELWRW